MTFRNNFLNHKLLIMKGKITTSRNQGNKVSKRKGYKVPKIKAAKTITVYHMPKD